MIKVLVCQHVPHESLGTPEELLRNKGFRIRYANFSRYPDLIPCIDDYDGLIILGGPMNVDQASQFPHLNTELSLIENALKKGIPIIGICLGAQLIAKALGARVYDNPEKEIGWHDVSLTEEGLSDPLFQEFQKTERLFHWHGQTFEIPKGAQHLASSSLCRNQAFRFTNNVYGFQFHIEVDQNIIHRWLTISCHQEELAQLSGKVFPEAIQKETPLYISRLDELSNSVFNKFSQLIGSKNKFIRLPSH